MKRLSLLIQIVSCFCWPAMLTTAAAFTGRITAGPCLVVQPKSASIPSGKVFWERASSCQRPRCSRRLTVGISSLASSSSSSSFASSKATDTLQQHEVSSSKEAESCQQNKDDENLDNINEAFQKLCRHANVQPSGLLRLDESINDGIRGVFVQRSVPQGDVVLSIPLASCLRDDDPPEWMSLGGDHDDDDDDDEGSLNPGAWATRLAASLLELQLGPSMMSHSKDENSSSSNNNIMMKQLWLDLLPNANLLRASLPIHWSDETLQSTQCSALELAVDTAFFARAEAREDILHALKESSGDQHHTAPASFLQLKDEETKRRFIDNALDLVQTRSCRVLINKSSSSLSKEDASVDSSHDMDPSQPLRLLAPVFDFINHPSQGQANAGFALEVAEPDGSPHLVVRSLRPIEANTEVLIDYGESARPAWRCLSSYGFVPTYERAGEGDDDEDEQNQQVAEVFVNGVRYQVGPSSVPQEMVTAMAAALHPTTLFDPDQQEQGEIVLTKEIAINLGQRISEDAFHKLLEPPSFSASMIVEEEDDNDDDKHDELQTPEQILSSKQAAALRFYQHRVLMDCALGLRDWAMQQR